MRQIFRVKNATPSGIIPAGNSNANLHFSYSGNARSLRVPLGAQASWNCSAFAGGRSELECRTPRSLRSRVLHQGHRHFRSDIYFVCQTTPVEFAQACFLTLTEIKEKMFAIIFSAELG